MLPCHAGRLVATHARFLSERGLLRSHFRFFPYLSKRNWRRVGHSDKIFSKVNTSCKICHLQNRYLARHIVGKPNGWRIGTLGNLLLVQFLLMEWVFTVLWDKKWILGCHSFWQETPQSFLKVLALWSCLSIQLQIVHILNQKNRSNWRVGNAWWDKLIPKSDSTKPFLHEHMLVKHLETASFWADGKFEAEHATYNWSIKVYMPNEVVIDIGATLANREYAVRHLCFVHCLVTYRYKCPSSCKASSFDSGAWQWAKVSRDFGGRG